MGNEYSDAGNHAVRVFLNVLSKNWRKDKKNTFCDLTPEDKSKIMSSFGNKCCYCNKRLSYNHSDKQKNNLNIDHLIPNNEKFCGLDIWNNYVPACIGCNNSKADKDWRDFLREKIEEIPNRSAERRERTRRIHEEKIFNYINTFPAPTSKETKKIKKIAKKLYEKAEKIVNITANKYDPSIPIKKFTLKK